MNYTAYTDESYTTGARYRSICSFSFRTEAADDIRTRLLQILEESDVGEFKWQKVKDAKYRFCANKIVDFVVNSLCEHDMRIDVVIWDTHDRRHSIIGRDDNANFERMFFHLLSNSMKRRKRESNWRVFPDQRMGIDWNTVRDCLDSVGCWHEYIDSPLFGGFFSDPYYTIDSFQEVDSKLAPSCQVSDLFAGISVFSKNYYGRYLQWKLGQQPSLFQSEDADLSNREKCRFNVIDNLNNQCKKRRLGVSLKTNKCFSTPNPNNRVNFWHYESQTDLDKAPIQNV